MPFTRRGDVEGTIRFIQIDPRPPSGVESQPHAEKSKDQLSEILGSFEFDFCKLSANKRLQAPQQF